LPSGYPLMFGMALIPPLWFAVMDPKVMAWAQGDLSKVNVLPSMRERLMRRYATPSAA
jgi:alkane 1-monooxygenase